MIESQYWQHWEYFPALHGISQEIVQELRGILLHAIGGIVVLITL